MKIGLDVFLTIVLAILKVAGVINVSWLVVFLPVIVSTALLFLVMAFVGFVAVKAKHVTITKNGGRI